jgi:hypothetical protein
MTIYGFGNGVYRSPAAMQPDPGVVRIAITAIDHVDIVDNVQMLEYIGDVVTAHASGQVQYLN